LDTRVHKGDEILFCGNEQARGRMDWTLLNDQVLHYLGTGEPPPMGVIWRWLTRIRGRRAVTD
jgi:hypothetical protein